MGLDRPHREKWIVAAVVVVVAAVVAMLVWPHAETAPVGVAAVDIEEAAYWSERANAEAEADARRRAAQAQTPSPRTAPLTGINGELDLMPVRRAPAVSTGQRMFYSCKAARAAGYENIPIGHPAYHPDMDGDGDGWACEPPPPEGRRR